MTEVSTDSTAAGSGLSDATYGELREIAARYPQVKVFMALVSAIERELARRAVARAGLAEADQHRQRERVGQRGEGRDRVARVHQAVRLFPEPDLAVLPRVPAVDLHQQRAALRTAAGAARRLTQGTADSTPAPLVTSSGRAACWRLRPPTGPRR